VTFKAPGTSQDVPGVQYRFPKLGALASRGGSAADGKGFAARFYGESVRSSVHPFPGFRGLSSFFSRNRALPTIEARRRVFGVGVKYLRRNASAGRLACSFGFGIVSGFRGGTYGLA
jgi:hypothetical protein